MTTDIESVIESAVWEEATLLLTVKVLDDGSRWRVTCSGVSQWTLESKFVSGIRIADENDPLLWRTQFAIYPAYFAGRPNDPFRAVCDLLSTLPVGPRQLYLSPNQMATLLASGSGCLGYLPVPAIRLCKDVLKHHGVELYPLGPDLSESSSTLVAILFGSESYVVAAEFSIDKLP